jgi:MerR family transcriptional regulator, light-induced transcriptional regulator
MSFYTIKDLERFSSQKAHTIRMWEQRYALLTPERTSTNIRYYNDDQLKKLLNVCTLINRGMKISHISRLSKPEIAAEIGKIIVGTYPQNVQIEAIINETLIAISKYDEAHFNEMFSTSVGILGLRNAYIKVIYPMLVRTGLMWTSDTLIPSQEHFLSNLVRQKLFTAIDSLPLPSDPDQTWVLFLNEQEDHEIGLLFANYLLRQSGKRVIYLGARVPYSNLSNVIKSCSATHVYTFFVRNQLENELESLVNHLRNDFAETTLCFSGGEQTLVKMIQENHLNHISTVENLLHIIES